MLVALTLWARQDTHSHTLSIISQSGVGVRKQNVREGSAEASGKAEFASSSLLRLGLLTAGFFKISISLNWTKRQKYQQLVDTLCNFYIVSGTWIFKRRSHMSEGNTWNFFVSDPSPLLWVSLLLNHRWSHQVYHAVSAKLFDFFFSFFFIMVFFYIFILTVNVLKMFILIIDRK